MGTGIPQAVPSPLSTRIDLRSVRDFAHGRGDADGRGEKPPAGCADDRDLLRRSGETAWRAAWGEWVGHRLAEVAG